MHNESFREALESRIFMCSRRAREKELENLKLSYKILRNMWKLFQTVGEIFSEKNVNALIFHDKPKFVQTVRSKIKHSAESLWCFQFIYSYNSASWKAKSVEHSTLSRSLIFIHSCMISVRFSRCGDVVDDGKNLWIFAFVEKQYGMLWRERKINKCSCAALKVKNEGSEISCASSQ